MALLAKDKVCRKSSKHCRELWWKGIPPKVRGRVWSYVIGNELNLSEGCTFFFFFITVALSDCINKANTIDALELYKICCARAQELMISSGMDESQCAERMNDKALTKKPVTAVTEGLLNFCGYKNFQKRSFS